MVTHVTSDPALRLTHDRSARPQADNSADGQQHSASPKAKGPAADHLEINDARKLYRIENIQKSLGYQKIERPEQAREILGRVLQQLTEMPAQALQSHQSGGASQIARLLESAPA